MGQLNLFASWIDLWGALRSASWGWDVQARRKQRSGCPVVLQLRSVCRIVCSASSWHKETRKRVSVYGLIKGQFIVQFCSALKWKYFVFKDRNWQHKCHCMSSVVTGVKREVSDGRTGADWRVFSLTCYQWGPPHQSCAMLRVIGHHPLEYNRCGSCTSRHEAQSSIVASREVKRGVSLIVRK